jgi:hypothetical protein
MAQSKIEARNKIDSNATVCYKTVTLADRHALSNSMDLTLPNAAFSIPNYGGVRLRLNKYCRQGLPAMGEAFETNP